MKKVEERATLELLELTLQLHSRSSSLPYNKEMHDASIEARQELEKRIQTNKKIYRALYGDGSRIMLIIATNITEAIRLANTEIIEGEFGIENFDPHHDIDKLSFVFGTNSVFEIGMEQESKVIDDIKVDMS